MTKLQSLVCFASKLSVKITRAVLVAPGLGIGEIAYVTVAPLASAVMLGDAISVPLKLKLMESVRTEVSLFWMVALITRVTVSTDEPGAGETAVTVALCKPGSGTGIKIK